ncbi:hypothetical protein [Brevundimonas sp.]|jgi:hypothetical protein|uniref:hypothetical protein n=1 Tax=Brevundimonas sp. TaxID=1871086 RepID=UPI0017D2AB40|nr:hypothetical protein [Brevundimonas sp.]MBA4808729.1 hypothetical protein [Brevundimonas sp.]
MTIPDDDWTDLTQAWTETPDDGPRLDAGFIRAVRRRDRLARINFIAELAGGLMVIAAMGWGLHRGLPLPAALAALAFGAFALGVTLWSRRGDPGLLTDTPQAVLRSAIGQARIGRRWALAGVATSLAGAVFLAIMLTMTDTAAPRTAPVFAGGFVFLWICIGFYLRHARRCRRRMAAHQAALDALDERPSDPAIRS